MCGLLGEVAVIIRKLGLNMIVILLVGGVAYVFAILICCVLLFRCCRGWCWRT